ncbi:hypothetical protein GCG54_00014301 [Colletotrichum gloeosporioides]|uniref:Uncharacterized protein n=1 Tax=Colletotrichum gloeosporioides TaxID=474922 RepID=A0A8H4FIV1_COLGL|nr:uncharacterized protein GCG54_00014301 [Colletotrichum gloeosporioides]KAF3802594.1 hypothetical protein GCG54_00014301 [Colletotrichum gloeosporioides]
MKTPRPQESSFFLVYKRPRPTVSRLLYTLTSLNVQNGEHHCHQVNPRALPHPARYLGPSLDIKDDIPLAHIESPRLFNTSTYISGGVFFSTPLEVLVAPALDNGTTYRHHRTWKVCAFSTAPPITWTPDTQRQMNDAGDCQAFWSDA